MTGALKCTPSALPRRTAPLEHHWSPYLSTASPRSDASTSTEGRWDVTRIERVGGVHPQGEATTHESPLGPRGSDDALPSPVRTTARQLPSPAAESLAFWLPRVVLCRPAEQAMVASTDLRNVPLVDIRLGLRPSSTTQEQL